MRGADIVGIKDLVSYVRAISKTKPAAVICCHDSNPRVDASQTFPSGAAPIL